MNGRVALIVHPTRAAAKELAEAARAWWEAHDYEVVEVTTVDGSVVPEIANGDVAFAVSLGGDGTMLRTVQLTVGRGVPVLGVNLGNLGYLTQVEPASMEGAFERLLAGDYEVEERMTLDISLRSGAARTPRALLALNEAALEKTGPGHTIRVGVSIDDRPFLTYAVDGILVASPTGSTAYNFSARGPILSPHLRAMVLTPVSPHMLFDRSLVLEPDESIGLRLLDDRPAALVVDGSTVAMLEAGDTVDVAAGPRPARIVCFGRRDFHAVLRAKFGLTDR
ncbi:MAG TPA: NAD(+)/NADH kinase [Acidimicrobiales bacterium]|nr:NAD(+)/NADH kinase [Acidimicrobiales bacterium]